jgi:hypothetical protein
MPGLSGKKNLIKAWISLWNLAFIKFGRVFENRMGQKSRPAAIHEIGRTKGAKPKTYYFLYGPI